VALAYFLGHRRSVALAAPLGGIRHLHSLAFYYAMRSALWCALPAIIVLGAWLAFDDVIIRHLVMNSLPPEVLGDDASARSLVLSTIQNVASGSLPAAFVSSEVVAAAETLNRLRTVNAMALTVVVIVLAMFGGAWAWLKISPQLRARQQVEKILKTLFMLCAVLAILTTVGIVMSVLFESLEFFRRIPATEFLFGLKWSPQTALRADQVAAQGAFGAIPLFVG